MINGKGPPRCSETLAWDWRPGQEEAGVGKALCNGSGVIDAASYFECHFPDYGFGWGNREPLLYGFLSLFYFLL